MTDGVANYPNEGRNRKYIKHWQLQGILEKGESKMETQERIDRTRELLEQICVHNAELRGKLEQLKKRLAELESENWECTQEEIERLETLYNRVQNLSEEES